MARIHRRLTLQWRRASGYKLERHTGGTIFETVRVPPALRGSILETEPKSGPVDLYDFDIVPRDASYKELMLDDVRPEGVLALEDLLNLRFDNKNIITSIMRYVGKWGPLHRPQGRTCSTPLFMFRDAIAEFPWAADLEPSVRLRELRKITLRGGIKVVNDSEPASLVRFLWALMYLLTKDKKHFGRCGHKNCERYFIGERGARRLKCRLHSKKGGQQKSS